MGPEVAAAAAPAAGIAGSWLTPAVSAALVAGGTAAQMAATRQQRKRQQGILDRALDKSGAVQRDGAAQVLDEAQTLAPGARLAAMMAAEDAAAQRTAQDTAGASLETASGQGAAVSDDFRRAKAQRAQAEGERQTAIGRELARVRSVGDVQQAEGLRRSALAESLQSMYQTNAANMQAAQNDAAAVDAPWYGDVGKIAALVGTVGSLMAPAAGTAAAGGSGITAGAQAPGPLGASSATGSSWLGRGVRLGNAGRGSWMVGG